MELYVVCWHLFVHVNMEYTLYMCSQKFLIALIVLPYNGGFQGSTGFGGGGGLSPEYVFEMVSSFQYSCVEIPPDSNMSCYHP